MEEFFKACAEFDWYYQYSDDHRVFMAGNNAHKSLFDMSLTNPVYRKIYAAWEKYMFSGKPLGTDHVKKPELSDFKE